MRASRCSPRPVARRSGLAAALRFALHGAPVAAGIGFATFGLAWSYSAPPLRLAARGLGELDTALVVAVLVPAASYAAFTGCVDAALARAVVAPGAAMFAMMLCVELPDVEADLGAGKRTLVVRWGPARTWQVVAAVALTAAAVAVADALRLRTPGAFALLPAAGAAAALVRACLADPRPAWLAFWGVALYALVTGGLALAYALAAVAR